MPLSPDLEKLPDFHLFLYNLSDLIIIYRLHHTAFPSDKSKCRSLKCTRTHDLLSRAAFQENLFFDEREKPITVLNKPMLNKIHLPN